MTTGAHTPADRISVVMAVHNAELYLRQSLDSVIASTVPDGLMALCRTRYEDHITEWFSKTWDTAQRAWFLIAADNRTALVEQTGFVHFWAGSSRAPKDVRHPQLDRYLAERARRYETSLPPDIGKS